LIQLALQHIRWPVLHQISISLSYIFGVARPQQPSTRRRPNQKIIPAAALQLVCPCASQRSVPCECPWWPRLPSPRGCPRRTAPPTYRPYKQGHRVSAQSGWYHESSASLLLATMPDYITRVNTQFPSAYPKAHTSLSTPNRFKVSVSMAMYLTGSRPALSRRQYSSPGGSIRVSPKSPILTLKEERHPN